MRQYQIITKSYRWEYDVEEHPESTCKLLGVISSKGFQDRCLAIAAGEWVAKSTEPKCWRMPLPEGYEG